MTYEDAVDSLNEYMLEAFLGPMNMNGGRSSELARQYISLLIFQVIGEIVVVIIESIS